MRPANRRFRRRFSILFQPIYLREKCFSFGLLFIFFLLLVYYRTNLFFDWDNPSNWTHKKRSWEVDFNTYPHYRSIPNVNCGHFLEDDAIALELYKEDGRYSLEKHYNISHSCEDIRSRIISTRRYPSVRNRYAISRVVYKDYYWLEASLSHTYSPDNQYCYAIDSKGPDEFVDSLRQLSKCIPNVHIIDERFNYDSNGHYINYGHWKCTLLLHSKTGWSYILWLQNYDLMLRTNREMSSIMDFLNGSQSVGHKPAQWKRYNIFGDWSAKGLKLWKKPEEMSEQQKNAVLEVSQMYNEVFLSRQLIDFVVDKMNIEHVLDAFEKPFRFATDEMLWATLLSTPDLQLPGQVEGGCQTKEKYITRFNTWQSMGTCLSGQSRHGTCIFGMEYLPLFYNKLHQIAANKIVPSFDYGLLTCMAELLYNRTFFRQTSPAMEFYSYPNDGFC